MQPADAQLNDGIGLENGATAAHNYKAEIVKFLVEIFLSGSRGI
jgi:hypothetical protein